MGNATKPEGKGNYTSMKTCNFIVSAFSAVIGGAIIFFSLQLGVGTSKRYGIKTGTWPFIMGVAIVLFAVIIFLYTLKNAKKLSDLDYTDSHGDHLYRVSIHLWENIQVYKAIGMISVYVILLKYLGMYISSLILIPALMWFLMPDEKKADRKKALITVAIIDVCVVLAIYLIFDRLLATSLPQPFWA